MVSVCIVIDLREDIFDYAGSLREEDWHDPRFKAYGDPECLAYDSMLAVDMILDEGDESDDHINAQVSNYIDNLEPSVHVSSWTEQVVKQEVDYALKSAVYFDAVVHEVMRGIKSTRANYPGLRLGDYVLVNNAMHINLNDSPLPDEEEE